MYKQNFKRKESGEVISPADYNKLPNAQQHDYESVDDQVTHLISGDKETGLLLHPVEGGEGVKAETIAPPVQTENSETISTAVEKVETTDGEKQEKSEVLPEKENAEQSV